MGAPVTDPPSPPRGQVFRLEPLGPEHNERDHAAWMGSIEHIHTLPGFREGDIDATGWPYEMSLDDNLADLVMHRREFDERIAYVYSVLDPATDDVIGCVYIDPDDKGDAEMKMICWTRASHAHLYEDLNEVVLAWLAADWPFESVRAPGRGPISVPSPLSCNRPIPNASSANERMNASRVHPIHGPYEA